MRITQGTFVRTSSTTWASGAGAVSVGWKIHSETGTDNGTGIYWNHSGIKLRSLAAGTNSWRVQFTTASGTVSLDAGDLAHDEVHTLIATHTDGAQALYLNGSTTPVATGTLAGALVAHSGFIQFGDKDSALGVGDVLDIEGFLGIVGKALSATEAESVENGSVDPKSWDNGSTITSLILPCNQPYPDHTPGDDPWGETGQNLVNGDWAITDAGSANVDFSLNTGTPVLYANHAHHWDDLPAYSPAVVGIYAEPLIIAEQEETLANKILLTATSTTRTTFDEFKATLLGTPLGHRYAGFIVQLGGLGNGTIYPGQDYDGGNLISDWITAVVAPRFNSTNGTFKDELESGEIVGIEIDYEPGENDPAEGMLDGPLMQMEHPRLYHTLARFVKDVRDAIRTYLSDQGYAVANFPIYLFACPDPVNMGISTAQIDRANAFMDEAFIDATQLVMYPTRTVGSWEDQAPEYLGTPPTGNIVEASHETNRVNTFYSNFTTNGTGGTGIDRPFVDQISWLWFAGGSADDATEPIVSTAWMVAHFAAWAANTSLPIRIWHDSNTYRHAAQTYALERDAAALELALTGEATAQGNGWLPRRTGGRARLRDLSVGRSVLRV